MNHYEGIVTREKFYEVQAEFARRNASRTPSQKLAPTGRSRYSAKYALTEQLVRGECRTLYRKEYAASVRRQSRQQLRSRWAAVWVWVRT